MGSAAELELSRRTVTLGQLINQKCFLKWPKEQLCRQPFYLCKSQHACFIVKRDQTQSSYVPSQPWLGTGSGCQKHTGHKYRTIFSDAHFIHAKSTAYVKAFFTMYPLGGTLYTADNKISELVKKEVAVLEASRVFKVGPQRFPQMPFTCHSVFPTLHS